MRLRLALVVACSIAGCTAAADGKLMQQVDLGLRAQGIHADLSNVSREQLAALYLELSSPDDEPGEDVRSRRNLINILRRNPETEILRQ